MWNFALILSVVPRTITVNSSGGAEYTRIQDAINAANDGDTINVAAGTYNENVNVNKSVNLVGDGAMVTIVQAASTDVHVFDVTVNNVNITGFKVTGATVWPGAGIYLDSSSINNLTGNNISNNYYGISLRSSGNNTLINNNATNNVYGIYLDSSSNNNLTGNKALNNNWGILLSYSSNNNNLARNNVLNNSMGIYLYSSSNNKIYSNFFNNTNNYVFAGSVYNNYWNITKTPGINIANSPFLAGNYWANSNGTGFSQTCADTNKDGICNSNYTLTSGNIDYLPLAKIPAGYGYISGTVSNGTGIPSVVVTTNTSNSTTTDASGFYYFFVSAGAFNLTATKEPIFYQNSSVIVTAISGKTVAQDIEFLKKPTGTISGTVTSV